MTAADLAESTSERVFPRRFEQFVLVTQLGEGGMGRVYVALTPKAELCVIKRFGNPRARLPDNLLDENKERFKREAEITKALSHPNIARTYHSVHRGLDSYLVQEFVQGCTLDYLTDSANSAGQHIAIPLAAFVVAQIADALAYVHAFRGMGLVHRDLTATNVMFSLDGHVKVIDFGIAKATLVGGAQLTAPHIVVGKELWTAPEVAHGTKPDRRTDLYALGLLAWYLLSGRDPSEQLDTPYNPTRVLPPPSTFHPEVPPELDAVVLKAVQPHPDRRFQTAEDFRQAISPFIPPAFTGPAELAKLVRRHQLTNEDEFFTALVDHARPLLKPETAPSSAKPPITRKANHRALTFGIAMVVLLFGASYLFYPATSESLPPPPISPQVPPPTFPPSESTPLVPISPSPSPQPPQVKPPLPATTPESTKAEGVATPDRPRKASSRTKSQTVTPLPPTSTSAPSDPRELLNAALAAAVSGDSAKALRLARASVELSPSVEAHVLIGNLLFRSDPDAAEASFEAALRLSPSTPQAIRALEKLRRRRQQD
jgi:serine/threonine protein kinase